MMDQSECEGDDATLENVNDYKLQFIKKTRTIQPIKKTLDLDSLSENFSSYDFSS